MARHISLTASSGSVVSGFEFGIPPSGDLGLADHALALSIPAGFSFDLSALRKKNGSYKVETDKYEFYINVCGPVTAGACQAGWGACQVAKRQVAVLGDEAMSAVSVSCGCGTAGCVGAVLPSEDGGRLSSLPVACPGCELPLCMAFAVRKKCGILA